MFRIQLNGSLLREHIQTEAFNDLTKSAQWVSSDTTVATMSVVAGFEGVAIASQINIGTTNITADFSGVTSNTATLEVRFF